MSVSDCNEMCSWAQKCQIKVWYLEKTNTRSLIALVTLFYECLVVADLPSTL